MAVNSTGSLTNNGGHIQVGPEFSPSSLFAASEVGVWYDPSDFSTLYQNTDGTSPVTAVEQPVGLMLDKSNTSTDNPDDSTGWTNVNTTFDTFTDDGNGGFTAEKTTPGGNDFANTTDTFNVAVGEWYKFSINVTATTLANYGVQIGSGSNGRSTAALLSGTGVKTGYLRVTNGQAGAQLSIITSSIGSITVASAHWERVLGRPAYAANNGTARPVLRSRYNLLTYSEQFDNAAWSKSSITVTADDTTAPDGTITADLIYPTTTGNRRSISRNFTYATNTSYVISIKAKTAGKTWLFVGYNLTFDATTGVYFDISSGVLGSEGTGFSNSSINLDDEGFYNCKTVFNTTGLSPTNLVIAIVDANGGISVTANGTDGIYIWGAQLVANSVFPQNTYQRIAAETDYDTDATKFLPYLAFTTDDAMSTASIDFSGTDEMTVFAGVTKQSNSGVQIIFELSSDLNSNFGTVHQFVNSNAGLNYASRGTTTVGVSVTTGYSAPVSVVTTGISDISLPDATLRANGVVIATSAATQGTGNFGNYPLYIGARNNSSLFFNGSLYSLIVRGKTSTFDEIRTTELWIAQKVGL